MQTLRPAKTGSAGRYRKALASGCLVGLVLLGGALGRQLFAQSPRGATERVVAQSAPPPERVTTLPRPPAGTAVALQPPMPKPEGMQDPKPGEVGPAPRPLQPQPGGPRLQRMGAPRGFGRTPVPSKEDLAEFDKFIGGFVDPKNTLELAIGRTRLMLLKEAPTRTQIADENIAALNLINPKQITLIGRRVGSTVLTLWFRDPNTMEEKILSYLVRVLPDPEEKERLERMFKALADEINEAFPDSSIDIYLVGDKVVVCGQAKDVAEATQILRIVRSNAPTEGEGLPVQNVSINVQPDPEGNLPSLRDFLVAGGPNIINMLRIPGEQQVMLKVTVAEINRAAARSIGLNFSITNDDGVQIFANRTGNIALGGDQNLSQGGGGGFNQFAGFLTNNLPVALDNGQISLAINALRTLSYARSLAEPNIVALNGQTATFQAGGQFPVPVVTGGNVGGGGLSTGLGGVSFVPFGVQLSFTPYITDKDRIRLNVAAEVSTRNLVSGASIQGANVPGLDTRNFQTTVELREGQTLAVAGLIQNNLGADTQRVPFISDIPILSSLTGFQRIQAGEQELVVLITPELVSPLDAKDVPPLPGSDLFEPSDCEFYFLGRLESRQTRDFRSEVRTDIHRLKAYKYCEDKYIYGPSGFSDEPLHP